MKNNFTSNRDNMTFNQKNKKAQSINILIVVTKINERVKTKKKVIAIYHFIILSKKVNFYANQKF